MFLPSKDRKKPPLHHLPEKTLLLPAALPAYVVLRKSLLPRMQRPLFPLRQLLPPAVRAPLRIPKVSPYRRGPRGFLSLPRTALQRKAPLSPYPRSLLNHLRERRLYPHLRPAQDPGILLFSLLPEVLPDLRLPYIRPGQFPSPLTGSVDTRRIRRIPQILRLLPDLLRMLPLPPLRQRCLSRSGLPLPRDPSDHFPLSLSPRRHKKLRQDFLLQGPPLPPQALPKGSLLYY